MENTSMNKDIENYITDYLANEHYYIIKYLSETDNYIFFISSTYNKNIGSLRVCWYNKNNKNIRKVSFGWSVNYIVRSNTYNQIDYKNFLEQEKLDTEIVNFISKNVNSITAYKPHSNYPLPYIKNGDYTIEEAISKIYLKDIICTRVLAETNNHIIVLCEETKYDGKPYIKDLIGITSAINQTGAEYATEIDFYEIPKFYHNLDNMFFDEDIINGCKNSDKFNTLRMLQ